MDAQVPGVCEAGAFDGTPMQLRQLVLDQIVTYPDTHDQADWINDCGTTACVAGWALLFVNGGLPLDADCWNIVKTAMEALDLTHYDAMRLFHYTTNEQAKMALKFLANGDPVDWAAVGHRMPHHGDYYVHELIESNVETFLSRRVD